MTESSQSNLRGLLRIAAFATAIGFGSVTSSLYSLRQGTSGMTFVFSFGSVVAFGLGAICGWLYWRVLGRMVNRAEQSDGSRQKPAFRMVMFNLLAGLIGLAAFLYPIRFVQPERMRDVVEGIGAAFLVLALIGVVLWRVIKFLNQDEDANR